MTQNTVNSLIIGILLINFQVIPAQTNDTTALRNYLDQAVERMNMDEYEKAYDYCQKALRLEPKCGMPIF